MRFVTWQIHLFAEVSATAQQGLFKQPQRSSWMKVPVYSTVAQRRATT